VKLVAKVACASSGCPAIFAEEGDTVVVQGYAVDAAESGVDLPQGELLVRIPRDLLQDGWAALCATQ
jgi:hypothetical protein